MSDLFGIGIPHYQTEAVMNVIKIADQHRFYLLTKQPQNLAKFSPFPPNAWVGVTATNYTMFAYALEYLKGIEAKVRYISIEPMLARLNIPLLDEVLVNCGISWVIIGQCTPIRPETTPEIEWVEEIVDAAVKANVQVFMKDNLAPLYASHFQHYKLRQELPK